MSTVNPLLSLIQGVAPVAPVAAPTVQVGTILDALVLQMLADGTAKLATPQGQLVGMSEAPLVPGSLVRLEVTAPGQLRLVATLAEAVTTGGGSAAPAQIQTASSDAAKPSTVGASSVLPPPAEVQATAVSTAVQAAAGQQRSLAPLLADLTALASHPDSPLPAPVRAAAAAVLALPLEAEKLDGAALRDAFARSGLFHEAQLAGLPGTPGTDLKSALLALRDALQTWRASLPAADVAPKTNSILTPHEAPAPLRQSGELLAHSTAQSLMQAVTTDPRGLGPLVTLGPQRELLEALSKEMQQALPPQAAAMTTAEPPEAINPPPYRHGPLSPQPAAQPALALDAAPEEIATRLLDATDGALARQTLAQIASLPDMNMAEAGRGDRPQASWTFELPMRTPDGAVVVPFEIARDGRNGGSREGERAPSWQARFSTDLPGTGPVHAQVTLTGERAAVTLWAERGDTALALKEGMSILEAALREAALEPGALRIVRGAPSVAPAGPGAFLDQAT